MKCLIKMCNGDRYHYCDYSLLMDRINKGVFLEMEVAPVSSAGVLSFRPVMLNPVHIVSIERIKQ